MNRLLFPTLLILLSLVGIPPQAHAANPDIQNYQRAFAALDAGHPETAVIFSLRGRDPALNKILRGAYMAQPGNDYRYEDIVSFVNENPGWPGLTGILMVAEQRIPANTSPLEVISWFTAHPPLSLNGFYRFVDALNASGDADNAIHAIRTRWIEGEFSKEDLETFYARFASILDEDSHWARLDRLLWKNDAPNAHLMYAYVTPDQKAVAEARLALAARTRRAQELLNLVPPSWRHDPGLQFELLRWYITDKLDQKAIAILLNNPENKGRPISWWEQRQIMVRRVIDNHDYALAYRLAAENGQTGTKSLLQAEFLAGWIALRLLNDPDRAQKHFETLQQNASTPVSRARGDYWLGRTFEAKGNTTEAIELYQEAASFNLTYYGQLAETRIETNPTIKISAEPPIPETVRSSFYSQDMVTAISHLYALGEVDRAHTFLKAVCNIAPQRADFVLLTELAYKLGRPDFAIETTKAASQKNFIMSANGYPMLNYHIPDPPDPAFTHALIRQESLFNVNAESPAGAYGLMQLMPATAKGVAHQLGIHFKKSRLSEPEYNIRLGTAYIHTLINHYGGSYVLALAGYNAGPGRLNEWLTKYGNPRNPAIDPVDWVELIPVNETRNYIQRILESLQIYRARQHGNEVPLLIQQDLRR